MAEAEARELDSTEREVEAGEAPATDHAGHPGGHGHPPDRTYVGVALILGVLTAIEIALYYFPPGRAEVPALLILMVIKFWMVVMWFMHLKFDSRIFSRLFMIGLALAVAVYVITLFTFHFWF